VVPDDEDEDKGDEEPEWVPGPAQRAGRGDVLRERSPDVAAFGGFLVIGGTVLQLSPSWPRDTVLGLSFLLLFARGLLPTIGWVAGVFPLLPAGGALGLEIVAQFLFWPGNPSLYSTAPFSVMGALVVCAGYVQAKRSSAREAGD
jgi:hypothetical protein